MSWNQILAGFIYLAVVLVLVVIGKWVYDALHRGFVLRTELVEKALVAVATSSAGTAPTEFGVSTPGGWNCRGPCR